MKEFCPQQCGFFKRSTNECKTYVPKCWRLQITKVTPYNIFVFGKRETVIGETQDMLYLKDGSSIYRSNPTIKQIQH
ncbi:MAG: hypothetical protein UX04_C0007G0015 [Microgenomates group bacterium GW2011_GWF2_45_18]|nr:MAG: hypothetical protein UX04_C0007G0015 [Microgenomates group bacterium GW2011_GWF2_45_18]